MSTAGKLTRRRFIGLGITTIAGALFAGFYFHDFNTVVFKIIRSDLGQLNLNEQDILQFSQDAAKERHWEKKYFDWKKKLFVRIGFMLGKLWKGFPYYYKYKQYRSEITGDFLLSTDFFINRMDKDKEIKYIAVYNPYKRACSNPFSNLYYPSV